MSQHNFTIKSGGSIHLLTAGKYCEKDIVVTAESSVDNGQFDAILDGTLTELNSNVTNVRMYACRGIDSLLSVNLPEANEIGSYAFNACGELVVLNAPKVETIGSYAFASCKKIDEILFPIAKSIPSYCFSNCTALRKVDIGMASSIGGNAFGSCTSLEHLIIRRTSGVSTLNSSSFSSANFDGYVYVPAALVDSYKSANYWSSYANQFRAIEDYPDICGA